MRRANWIAGGAVLLGVALLGTIGSVQADEEGEARIVEVLDDDVEGTSILVALGSQQEVKAGQSLEVRRDGKTIGYGSVDKVYSKTSKVMATVGTIVDGAAPLKDGDRVRFIGAGFRRGSGKKPPVGKQPKKKGIGAKVVSVRDGIVLIDAGKEQGLQVGHLIQLQDPETGKEVGKIAIELLGDTSGGGLLVTGEAKVGCEAVVIGKVKEKPVGIDFVKLDFLGAVANQEHASRHRAPCHLGVPVRRVLRGSPAWRAGIGRNDRIIAVGGLVVRTIASVRERIQSRKSNRVPVLVLRGNRVLTVHVDFSR